MIEPSAPGVAIEIGSIGKAVGAGETFEVGAAPGFDPVPGEPET